MRFKAPNFLLVGSLGLFWEPGVAALELQCRFSLSSALLLFVAERLTPEVGGVKGSLEASRRSSHVFRRPSDQVERGFSSLGSILRSSQAVSSPRSSSLALYVRVVSETGYGSCRHFPPRGTSQ